MSIRPLMHLSELMMTGLRDVCSICNVHCFRLLLLLKVIAPFFEAAKLVWPVFIAFHCVYRSSDPVVRHQLVKCCVIPRSGWLMQEVAQQRTGLSWFRPRGRTSSKGV